MRTALPGLPGDQNSSIRYGTVSPSATVVTATPAIINATSAEPAEPDNPETGDGWDPDKIVDPADPRHEVPELVPA